MTTQDARTTTGVTELDEILGGGLPVGKLYLMQGFFNVARRVKPKWVVIDSLSEMRTLSRDSLRFRRHRLAIREYFGELACTVLVLDAGGMSSGDLQANTLPHGVVRMQQATATSARVVGG